MGLSEGVGRIGAAGKEGGSVIGKLMANWLFLLIIFILLINAVVIAIQQRSAWAGIQDLGSRFIYASNQLSKDSKQIILMQGIYNSKEGWAVGGFHTFLLLLSLMNSFLTVFLWIQLIYKIIPFTPISNNADALMSNTLLAVSIFLIFQMLVISVTAGVNGEMKDMKTGVSILMTPVTCYIDFAKATPYLLSPIVKNIDWVSPKSNLTTNYYINDTAKLVIPPPEVPPNPY